MNVSIVSIIDYWIGIPVCFFLTLIGNISKIIPLNRRRNRFKKFLFIQLSEMGSAILAYSAINSIISNYPDAKLFYMIFKKNRPSVDLLNKIPYDHVLTINDKSIILFFFDVIKNIIRLRKEKIDVSFDLELFSRATAILSFLCGSRVKVGFHKYRMEGLYRGGFFTHKIQYNFQQHLSKSFLSLVLSIEHDKKTYPTMDQPIKDDQIVSMRYNSSPKNLENIWAKLKKVNAKIDSSNNLIVLNPSAGLLPIRAWPLENYVELARKLLNDQKNYVILTGTNNDKRITDKIYKFLNNSRCIDLSGKTSFLELVDLYNISNILVTNDSGPAHFASLTSIKSFVFFGPETPILYAPLSNSTKILYSNFPCSPCITAFNHRFTTCLKSKCLEVITVNEVYELVKEAACSSS